MRLVFKGGTVGIAGHCVVAGDIGNAVSIHHTLYLAIIANLAGERFSSLLGVGLVFSAVTSEGIESFIAQVGGGVDLSIGCGTLDALAFYSQSTLVFLTICIGSFGPSGSAVFIVVDGAFFYAAIFRDGGCLVGGDFTGCHFRFGRYVVVTSKNILGHVDFIHIQLAVNSQGTANGNVASGCQGTGLDISGFHCAGGPDKTVTCIDITAVGTEYPSLGVDISAAGLDYTAIGLDGTTLGCHVAICIHGKVSIRPFDGTVSIESRFSRSRRIAAGKYAVRCNDGTVLAHFDALFVHGDLIITIFVQHQCFHSRGCGAVVSCDFGNHAVVAHFKIILGIGFLRIVFLNYQSITITVGFHGMVYVVDSKRLCGRTI